MAQSFEMIAKTYKGLEDVLAEELTALGANNIQKQRRAVSYEGDLALLYRSNYFLRTALRILVPIAAFEARNADEVYEQAKQIDWGQIMTAETSFSIDSTVYSEEFRHSKYVTYRVKDAIADYWTERKNRRPSVQLTNPDLYINVHIAGRHVTLSLDSSGESLHKRGYRVANTEAPLSEVLAAGMLLTAGWKGESDFYDLMCGSGTLPIEAALIAHNIAPGIFRKEFAFERWADYNEDLFLSISQDDSGEKDFEHQIYGGDAGYYAIQAAQKNVNSAGLKSTINLKQIRLQEWKDVKADGALVMLNPPYGQRLAQDKDIQKLYGEIGSTLKHQFAGATAWIISSNEDALKNIGLKPLRKLHLMNGDLDCLFNRYDLFEGGRKEFMSRRGGKVTKPIAGAKSPAVRVAARRKRE